VKHFDRHLKLLEQPEYYTVCMGDLIESALKTSKGDVYRQVGTPQQQRDWVIKRLKPYKHKILAMCTGNHEDRIYDRTGVDMTSDMAKELGVYYRSEGVWLKISFGSGNSRHEDRPYVYWCYATHGYGGARTSGAKAVKVERTATFIHADFYMMAHDHVVNVGNSVYLMPDNRTSIDKETGWETGKGKAWEKKLVKTNSFLKWGNYGEVGGFPPSSLETPLVKLAGTGAPRVRVES